MAPATDEIISLITERIVGVIHPEKIILFGSRAWGMSQDTSDIDLFVIVSNSEIPSYRRSIPVYRALRGIGVPVDVVVKTRDEVERSRHVRSTLTWKVMEEGKVVYG